MEHDSGPTTTPPTWSASHLRIATLIVIPVEYLDDDFFRLSTRIAGELVPRLLTSNSRVRILPS
jgi:hypothetical protein